MKKIMYWILIALGTLCLLDVALVLIRRTAFHSGTVVLLAMGFSLIGFGALKLVRKGRIFKKPWLSKTATVCLVLLLCSFAAVESLIWTSTKDQSDVKVDYVILLGAGLQGDKISETFKNRIDRCAAYLEANPKAKVVVSGGQGVGETITEAEGMRRYLIQQGIEPKRIILEDKATSTYDNLAFSKAILDKVAGRSHYTVLIATNDFHLFRAKMLAKRLGLSAHGLPADTWWGAFPSNCIREYFAVVKSYLVDR